MTIRERILSVYRGERTDRVPVSIYKRYLPVGTSERTVRNTGLGILEFVPAVSLLAPPWHVASGYVSEVKGADLRVEFSWEGGELAERRTFRTPIGTVSQRMRKDPFYGSDWALRYYIQSIDDYRLMAYLVENTVFRPRYSSISRAKANLGEDGVVLGRIDRSPYQKLLIELAGPERLLLDLYTDPDPVVSLIEDMNKRMDEQVGLAIESEADVIWQPDNITSDLTPPKEFARFLIPLYEKYGRWCEEAGKIYVVHMDGKLKGLLDSIARTPIHVIESFSFAEMAGDLSVPEALAAWPEKTLCPNFPASLAEKPASEIEDYLEKRSLEFGEAPWMLQISEDIPPGSHLKLLPVLASFFQ